MTAVAKKKASLNFDDVLNQNATAKKPAKKKASMPTVETPDAIRAAVDTFNNAKKAMAAAKAEMDAVASDIIDFGREKQDEFGFSNNFRKSFKLEGNESEVKFVSSNRFGVNVDDEPEIRELLGDSFDDLMTSKFNVTLKAEVFESESLKAELMNLIGDKFSTFFDTQKSLTVNDDFDKNVYNVLDKDGLEDLRIFVKPYKPSLK